MSLNDMPPVPVAPTLDATAVASMTSIPLFVVGIISITLVTMLAILGFHEVPKDNQALIYTVVGSFSSSLTLIVGYYFGSSSSSKGKDQTIATLITPTPKGPTP